MGGYAWVTLATNNSYSLGALVLAHSLKKANTAHKLVVLITPAVSQPMREQLQTVFDVVKVVDVLDSKDEAHLALMKRPDLGITFTKIHCWRLVEFEKCVFLDADTLVVRNCDELFEKEEFSAAPDVSWPDCFNSGVFVYRPSVETFNKILQFAVENRSFDGGDQGLLNQFFSDWATEDIKKHLPFVYNLTSIAAYSYIPAFKHYGAETRIVHFIGTGKPWLQQLDVTTRTVTPTPGSEHLAPLLQQWWDLFCEKVHPGLDKSLESNNDGMSHPPVEARSNILPIALTDEPQTALVTEPCTPYREKDDFRQHNLPYLPFHVKGPSGELLNVEFLTASVVPPAEPDERKDEQQRHEHKTEERYEPDQRENENKKESEGEFNPGNEEACQEHHETKEPEKNEEFERENSQQNEQQGQYQQPQQEQQQGQQQEEPPPPKDPFDYYSFFPDETCISTYLEKNVVTYQPFEDHHHHQHRTNSTNSEPQQEQHMPSLPRFLTIPQNDQRQSGNVDTHPQEEHQQHKPNIEPPPQPPPPPPQREPTPPREEQQPEPVPEKRELSKSKSMSSFPWDLTTIEAPPRKSIWKSQPDLNVDPNRRYSMPKLKPILPKQRSFSKSVPSEIPKVTQYTEFLISSEYKDPVDLPKDTTGFVETHIHKLRRSKSDADISERFGPLPYSPSPVVEKPVVKKRLPRRHFDNECYDLTQCKRQLGNKPKPKDADKEKETVHALPALKPIIPAKDKKPTIIKKRKSKDLGEGGKEKMLKREPKKPRERKREVLTTPRNVSTNGTGNNLDEILKRLREFSKDYQHFFGVGAKPLGKTVTCKNAKVQASEEGGDCGVSEAFETFTTPVSTRSRDTQTLKKSAVDNLEFRQFRNYVKDQRETSQKGLLGIQDILSLPEGDVLKAGNDSRSPNGEHSTLESSRRVDSATETGRRYSRKTKETSNTSSSYPVAQKSTTEMSPQPPDSRPSGLSEGNNLEELTPAQSKLKQQNEFSENNPDSKKVPPESKEHLLETPEEVKTSTGTQKSVQSAEDERAPPVLYKHHRLVSKENQPDAVSEEQKKFTGNNTENEKGPPELPADIPKELKVNAGTQTPTKIKLKAPSEEQKEVNERTPPVLFKEKIGTNVETQTPVQSKLEVPLEQQIEWNGNYLETEKTPGVLSKEQLEKPGTDTGTQTQIETNLESPPKEQKEYNERTTVVVFKEHPGKLGTNTGTQTPPIQTNLEAPTEELKEYNERITAVPSKEHPGKLGTSAGTQTPTQPELKEQKLGEHQLAISKELETGNGATPQSEARSELQQEYTENNREQEKTLPVIFKEQSVEILKEFKTNAGTQTPKQSKLQAPSEEQKEFNVQTLPVLFKEQSEKLVTTTGTQTPTPELKEKKSEELETGTGTPKQSKPKAVSGEQNQLSVHNSENVPTPPVLFKEQSQKLRTTDGTQTTTPKLEEKKSEELETGIGTPKQSTPKTDSGEQKEFTGNNPEDVKTLPVLFKEQPVDIPKVLKTNAGTQTPTKSKLEPPSEEQKDSNERTPAVVFKEQQEKSGTNAGTQTSPTQSRLKDASEEKQEQTSPELFKAHPVETPKSTKPTPVNSVQVPNSNTVIEESTSELGTIGEVRKSNRGTTLEVQQPITHPNKLTTAAQQQTENRTNEQEKAVGGADEETATPVTSSQLAASEPQSGSITPQENGTGKPKEEPTAAATTGKDKRDIPMKVKQEKAENGPKKPEEILCVPDFETPRTSRVSPPNTTQQKTAEEATGENVDTPRYSTDLKANGLKNGEVNGILSSSPEGAVHSVGKMKVGGTVASPRTPSTPLCGNVKSEGYKEAITKSGIAGAIAQLSLEAGGQQSPQSAAASSAHEEYLRRQNWETGNMDYMGRDSFDNIWSKICQTIEAKELEENAAGNPQPPTDPSKTEEKEKKPEETAESPVSLSAILQKCPEYIETLPGEPAAGPVEDDEIIFSKPENRQSCLTNIAEEEEAGQEGAAPGKTVKLSDILKSTPAPTPGPVSPPPAASTPAVAPPAVPVATPSPAPTPPVAAAAVSTPASTQPSAVVPATVASTTPTPVPLPPSTASGPSNLASTAAPVPPAPVAIPPAQPPASAPAVPAQTPASTPAATPAPPASTPAPVSFPASISAPSATTPPVSTPAAAPTQAPSPAPASAPAAALTQAPSPVQPSTPASASTPAPAQSSTSSPVSASSPAQAPAPSSAVAPTQAPSPAQPSAPALTAAPSQAPASTTVPAPAPSPAQPSTPSPASASSPAQAPAPSPASTPALASVPSPAQPSTPTAAPSQAAPSSPAPPPASSPAQAPAQSPASTPAVAPTQAPSPAQPSTPASASSPAQVPAPSPASTPLPAPALSPAQPSTPTVPSATSPAQAAASTPAPVPSPVSTTTSAPAAIPEPQPKTSTEKEADKVLEDKPEVKTEAPIGGQEKPKPEAGKPECTTVALLPQPPSSPQSPDGQKQQEITPEKKAEECKTVAIPSPPIVFPGAPFPEKDKSQKVEEKPQVVSEPIPLPPPSPTAAVPQEPPAKSTRSDSLKEEGKQKKGVFTKILEMVGVAPKEKNGTETSKSVFYDVDDAAKSKQEVKEAEKPAGEAPAEVKQATEKAEEKAEEKKMAADEAKQLEAPKAVPAEGQAKPTDSIQVSAARRSPSPKLTIPSKLPETEITTPTPPPQPDVPPRKNSAMLKVDETILPTPPVPEPPKEGDDTVKGKVSTEIDDIIGKAKSEVESLLQERRSVEKDSGDLINTMKLLMGTEQPGKSQPEEVEELRVTTEEERQRHKGEVVTSKLSDQILKAIPPPRRKAISEASASTSAIPKPTATGEQKTAAGESKPKPTKPSSIPVPPPRNKGKPTPPSAPAPPKGKGKK